MNTARTTCGRVLFDSGRLVSAAMPVAPEPATISLLGLGAPAVPLLRRGRTKTESGAAWDAAFTPNAYGLAWPAAPPPGIGPPGISPIFPDPLGFVIPDEPWPDEPWSDPPPPNASPF